MIDPLSKLAIQHGTDKFGYHDYTPNYHKMFSKFRNQKVRVLEIGVGGYQDEDRGGQSLATWRDYFPKGQIVGIDIQPKVMKLGKRVTILQGSQIDAKFLESLVDEHGPFDIIIDDGSHQNAHVIESYRLLWPSLAPGGIYVAEDVQTSFIARFGGSREMSQPNSVSYFADIMARMDFDQEDPLLDGLIAMERYHNMIAMHKDCGDHVGMAASASFAPYNNKTPKLLRIETSKLSKQFGKGEAQGTAKLLKGGAHDRDIVVVAANVLTPDVLRAGLDRLKARGILVIDGLLDLDSDALQDMTQRFVEVDHREITAQFTAVEIDPVAKTIYAIERYSDGLVLVKAPNDYPSNFAFDAKQPQAAKALKEMEKVLTEAASENGLAQYASMLTTFEGREAGRPWLDMLAEEKSTARVYFQLASGLARADRDFEKATELLRSALKHFPGDANFTQGLGSMLLSVDGDEEALELVEKALEKSPRNLNLVLLQARIVARLGDEEQAVTIGKHAIKIAPPLRKPQAQIVLAELLMVAARRDEAEEFLRDAISTDTRFAAKAHRMLSGLLKARGELDEAQDMAQKAVALSPQTKEYQTWQARLAA